MLNIKLSRKLIYAYIKILNIGEFTICFKRRNGYCKISFLNNGIFKNTEKYGVYGIWKDKSKIK